MLSANPPITDRFICAVERFKPFHEGKDKIWRFLLKTGRNWIELDVRFYCGTYYCSSDGVFCEIGGRVPIQPETERHLADWLIAIDAWYAEVSDDALASQERVLRRLSLQDRHGLILRSNVRRLLPGWCDIASRLRMYPGRISKVCWSAVRLSRFRK